MNKIKSRRQHLQQTDESKLSDFLLDKTLKTIF